MSTNKTKNYKLHLWEPQDSILRTEFNENSEKTDELILALRTYTDQQIQAARSHTDSGVSDAKGLAQQLSKQLAAVIPKLSFGSYVGDGSSSARKVEMGFRPHTLLIFTQSGKTNVNGTVYGGLLSEGYPLLVSDTDPDGQVAAEIFGTGVMVFGNNSGGLACNVSGVTYHYLAIH